MNDGGDGIVGGNVGVSNGVGDVDSGKGEDSNNRDKNSSTGISVASNGSNIDDNDNNSNAAANDGVVTATPVLGDNGSGGVGVDTGSNQDDAGGEGTGDQSGDQCTGKDDNDPVPLSIDPEGSDGGRTTA